MLASLQSSDKKDARRPRARIALRAAGRARGHRVGRHKYALAWEAGIGVLLRAALTVGDEHVELIEEPVSSSLPKASQQTAERRRTKPPANDAPIPRVHPTSAGGGCQVAGIRLHDQCIWIPLSQPRNEPALIAEIQRSAKQMKVGGRRVPGNLRCACDDRFV